MLLKMVSANINIISSYQPFFLEIYNRQIYHIKAYILGKNICESNLIKNLLFYCMNQLDFI